MKVQKIRCINSMFAKLCCKNKLKVLKELANGQKNIYGNVIEPANSIEDKYVKIRQCINECSKEELEIIELELKLDKVGLGKLERFRNAVFPLLISFLSIIIAVSELTDQAVDPIGLGRFTIEVPIVILGAYYFIEWRINRDAKAIDYILGIIRNRNRHRV